MIVLAACGGGGSSRATNRADRTTEPPQVVAARAKRDAICTCTDKPCVNDVLNGPLGREVEGPSVQDPAALRLLLGLGQDALACLYRVSGVPPVCIAMVETANTLSNCPALTDAQSDELDEKLQATTGAWTEIEWSTVPAEQVRAHERGCEDTAAAMRSLTDECSPPDEQPPAVNRK